MTVNGAVNWNTYATIEMRAENCFIQPMTSETPYISEDGRRYYSVRQASRLIGCVSAKTIWSWAAQGTTSFNFKLTVKHQKMQHAANRYRLDAKTHKENRLVIAEADVLALKEIFAAAGRTYRGTLTKKDKAALTAAANRLWATRLILNHW